MANVFLDEFFDMGTFTDDYYKNVIEPYKKGLRHRPSVKEAIKYARPYKAFLPQALGGTFYTKGSPMAMNFFRNLGRGIGNVAKFGTRFTGPFSLFMPSRELASAEITPEFIQEQQDLGQLPVQQMIAQQQAQTQQNIINQINQANQNNQNNQGGGSGGGGSGGKVSGPAGMSGPSSAPRGPDLRNRAQGGIVSINDLIGGM